MRLSHFLVLLIVVPCLAADQFGNISNLIGTAQVFSARRKAWKPAAMGQPLYVSDTVRTGVESRLELKSANGGIVRIDEKSLILIASVNDNEQRLEMAGGKVWANMRKIVGSKRKFEVYTPTAAAAIRGTIFRVNSGSDSTTDVLVYQGKVDVGPGQALKQQEAAKDERREVDGPTEVEGPTEISLEDWVSIIAGQQISVRKDGSYEKSKFDSKIDGRDGWVAYNQQRDSQQE